MFGLSVPNNMRQNAYAVKRDTAFNTPLGEQPRHEKIV